MEDINLIYKNGFVVGVKNKDLVDWYAISISENLSEGFIREFRGKM